jgi:hypothetical protein
MARMRLLKNCLPEIKKQDPGTCVTMHFIRELAIQGKISSVYAGSRRLINIDSLLDYLSQGEPVEPEQTSNIRKIRA